MQREGSANLQKRVYDMVAAYVYRKTESRCGIDWNAVKDHLKEENNSNRQAIPRGPRKDLLGGVSGYPQPQVTGGFYCLFHRNNLFCAPVPSAG